MDRLDGDLVLVGEITTGELTPTGQVIMGEIDGQLAYIVTKSYNFLTDKPSINGVELIGDKTFSELGIGQTYIYQQEVVSDRWVITHNLKKFPSVTVVDSAGTSVVGDVQYLNEDTLIVSFNAAFSGTAYLN